MGVVNSQKLPVVLARLGIYLNQFDGVHRETKRAGLHVGHGVCLHHLSVGTSKNTATFIGKVSLGVGNHFVDKFLFNLDQVG